MNTDFLHSYHINHFLWVVTAPISKYLEKPVCLEIKPGKSPFYRSWDPRDNQSKIRIYDTLFQKTGIAADSIDSILGCGCEHCDKPFPIYDSEVRQILKDYVPLLVSAWDQQAFEIQLKQAVPEFEQDYLFWFKKLNCGESNLEEVEQQLMVWKDAVSDELLINALLAIRFDLITRLI